MNTNSRAFPYAVIGRNGYQIYSGTHQACADYVARVDGATRFGWAIRPNDSMRRECRVILG